MLPRHLVKGHGMDPSEVDQHLPPTYRRRTKSEMARDNEDPDAADDDDPGNVSGDDQGAETDQGSDQGDAGQDDANAGTGSGDPDDEEPVRQNTVNADTIRAVIAQFEAEQAAKAQGISTGVQQAAAAAVPPPNLVRPAILRPSVLNPQPRHPM